MDRQGAVGVMAPFTLRSVMTPFEDDFELSQRLVHSAPVVRHLATALLACGVHYAGPHTRAEPESLQWAAWDAYHAFTWARHPADGFSPADAAEAAFVDSGFTEYDDDDSPVACMSAHVAMVVEMAARADWAPDRFGATS